MSHSVVHFTLIMKLKGHFMIDDAAISQGESEPRTDHEADRTLRNQISRKYIDHDTCVDK